MVISLAISQIFSIKKWPDREIWVLGRSRSFKMVQFDRPCTTFYCSAIATRPIAPSCTISELFDVERYRDLEIWFRGYSRSLKLVPSESLGAVFYLPSIVTIAVA